MAVIEAFKRGLRQWAVLRGRASRAEFWDFVLCAVLIAAMLIGIDIVLFGEGYAFGLADIWALAMLVPLVTALVRRLQDIGRSGWWVLLLLLPVVGVLVLIVWAAKPGEEGDNRFGPDPRALSQAT